MKLRQATKQPTSSPRWMLFFASVALFVAACSSGQTSGQGARTAEAHPQGTASGGLGDIEVLSDTQGVNFSPYLHGILNTIYKQWLLTIPSEAHPPQKLAGETQIRFTIRPDGELASMHLDASTHSDALNNAAWAAIAGVGAFPQLPEAFHGPNLELRIRFKVNEGPPEKL